MIPFDSRWYLGAYPNAAAEVASGKWSSAEQHYHRRGAALGNSPNRYFDERWYRSKYPDVTAAIESEEFQSGFHHYLLFGAKEGRQPNPAFVEEEYLASRPDGVRAVASGESFCSYEHYLSVGRFTSPPISENENVPIDAFSHIRSSLLGVDPIHVRILPEKEREATLNFVLPSLEMSKMSGGPNTALNVACRLAALGVPITLVSANTPVGNEIEIWKHIQSVSGIHRRLSNVQLVDASNPNSPAPIGVNDVFFATAWWTAQMISTVLPKLRQKKFFYLIQDFEPGLYAWSSEYALALGTYSFDFIPVFNSSPLAEYFIANRIGRFKDPEFSANALSFEPAVDRTHFHPEPRLSETRHRLLFYARPESAKRNLFDMGLAALKRLAERDSFPASKWDLRFIGEALPMTSLGNGIQMRPTPWLGFESYASLMRQSQVLLSLMLSPHPSYPPLEMACCGGFVVTNTFGTKTDERLKEYSANILTCQPTIADVADSISTAMKLVERRFPTGVFQPGIPASWDESLRNVVPFVMNQWSELIKVSKPEQAMTAWA